MRSSIKITFFVGIVLALSGLASCKKYLDRPLDANITEEDVFANFRSFQGFTEELYHALPDMTSCRPPMLNIESVQNSTMAITGPGKPVAAAGITAGLTIMAPVLIIWGLTLKEKDYGL